jgi:hypothetical protein
MRHKKYSNTLETIEKKTYINKQLILDQKPLEQYNDFIKNALGHHPLATTCRTPITGHRHKCIKKNK